MNKTDKIYVAGHRGMVGSAIVRLLEKEGFSNLIYADSKTLDLREQKAVHSFFSTEKPQYVFLAAAKVGGIYANSTMKGAFLYDNLIMQANVMEAARLNDVKKLLFLGSSCIYPKFAKQPIAENELLTGSLEATNEPYALAKISGLKMCDYYREQYGCDYISLMPTNLYGPNDNYDLKNSHVIPALLRKFHEAKLAGSKEVEVWGSGSPLREFLHVDDLAKACLFFMQTYSEAGHINIGTGNEITIKELAELVKRITGFEGNIFWNKDYPDGTPRKLLDCTKAFERGWSHSIDIENGIIEAYGSYVDNSVRN